MNLDETKSPHTWTREGGYQPLPVPDPETIAEAEDPMPEPNLPPDAQTGPSDLPTAIEPDSIAIEGTTEESNG